MAEALPIPGVCPASRCEVIAIAALLAWPAPVLAQHETEPIRGLQAPAIPDTYEHMPEAVRTTVTSVVVVAARSPADQEVSGSYEKATPGLVGGMAAGSRIGRISKQVGPVPVVIPIPVLTIPGAIFGGLSGAARREIQEFRDALTEDLVEAENDTLTDDGLALDVFWGIRQVPGLQSKILAPTVEIPADTDAILYVTFEGLGIDVQGKEAVITTTADATLRGMHSGRELYRAVIHYQDRDTLRNWTANDNALWRDYVNFARHYLGREISAMVFDRIEPGHQLRPVKTSDVSFDRKNERVLVSKSTRPTLAWELSLNGTVSYDAFTDGIDESHVYYDVEIFDRNRPVYVAEQIPDASHVLTMELEPCQTYRWSVRPSYRVNGDLRHGAWLRYPPQTGEDDDSTLPAQQGNGLFGRAASTAPAYTQDFPQLRIACGRR